jgi:hypothetical protein
LSEMQPLSDPIASHRRRERLRLTVYNPRLVLDDRFLAIRDVPLARSSFDEMRHRSEPHVVLGTPTRGIFTVRTTGTALGVLATIGAMLSQNAGR